MNLRQSLFQLLALIIASTELGAEYGIHVQTFNNLSQTLRIFFQSCSGVYPPFDLTCATIYHGPSSPRLVAVLSENPSTQSIFASRRKSFKELGLSSHHRVVTTFLHAGSKQVHSLCRAKCMGRRAGDSEGGRG